MSEGAWRKSNQMKEKRSFSTSYMKSSGPSSRYFASKIFTEIAGGAESLYEKEATYDPIQRDIFFIIPKISEYWPPNGDIKKRLEGTKYCMSMFGKNKILGENEDHKISRKGEIKTPKNINLALKRMDFYDSE